MRNPLILTAAFLLLTGAPSYAQSQQAPPPPQSAPNGQPGQAGQPHHGTPYMMRALQQMNLSDAQRSQIKSMVQSYRQQNPQGTDPQTRKANAKQLRSNILGVLSPDQQAQLKSNIKAMRQQHMQQMQQGAGQGAPPPNGNGNGQPPPQ